MNEDRDRREKRDPKWTLTVAASRKLNTKTPMIEEDLIEVEENSGKKRNAGYRIRKIIIKKQSEE